MTVNGVGSGIRSHGTGRLPAQPPAPVASPAAPSTAPPAASPANAPEGANRLGAAADQNEAPLPWAAAAAAVGSAIGGWGKCAGWWGGAKEHTQAQTAAFGADSALMNDVASKHFDDSGRAALAKLFDNGKLAPDVDPSHPGLAATVAGFLRSGGDPGVAQTILEQIARPSNIHQIQDHTCVTADLQQFLERTNPARYFRMASELMQHGTTVVSHDGNGNPINMTLSAQNRDAINAANMTPNARLNAAFQAAAMDLGNGGEHYALRGDHSFSDEAKTSTGHQGLRWREIHALAHLICDAPVMHIAELKAKLKSASPTEQDKLVKNELQAQLDAAKASGQPGLLVPMRVSGGVHLVMLYDMKQADAVIGDGEQGAHPIHTLELVDRLAARLDADTDVGTSSGPYSQGTALTRGGRTAPTSTTAVPTMTSAPVVSVSTTTSTTGSTTSP